MMIVLFVAHITKASSVKVAYQQPFLHLRDHNPTLFKEASKGKTPSYSNPSTTTMAAPIGSSRQRHQETLPDAKE